jgi:hypothetical protein
MTANSNRTYYHKLRQDRSLPIENLEALLSHCKVMMYEYIFVYIVLPLIIIITIIDFFA